ncbi:MAG TPA: hypothetical protein VNG51_03705 [Ktedonobacteraceae bacterium]|nr:hypothetical protein [Ktedonobacteraceae bacterium]
MFHDTIPEEREEQHQKLIALLRRGLHEPVALSSSEQSQIIDRVRERLMQENDLSSHLEEMPAQQAGQVGAGPVVRISARGGHLPRFVNGLVAVLVVGVLIGAALLLFRPSLHQNGTPPPTDSTGPTARTQVNGLQATIHLVTPVPYFLSELVFVDVSLTNRTHLPFVLDGSSRPDIACFSSALSVQITGGSVPFYTLPRLSIACLQPLFLTTLAPGQTLTIHYYLPVTKSGEVTIMMGGMTGPHQTNPLDGHWPSLRIHVNPQVPANRVISLHQQGVQVIIQAPPAARTHLLYRQTITCDQYAGGGPTDWSSLSTTALSQPACPTAHKHWQYIVSAPGYSIVAGKRDS